MTQSQTGLTVITTHANADFDALASMLAARLLYPGARAVMPSTQGKTMRNFWVQSVLYMMDPIQPKSIDWDSVERLVVVDTRQASRLGVVAEELERRPGLPVHLYDHHPDAEDDIKGEVEIVEPLGSCTALMIGLIRERGLEVTADQATFLALGLYEDTGAFTFATTTPTDLQAAAWLVGLGADLNTVADLIIRELDADQVGLLNQLLESVERHRIGGVEVVIATCATDQYKPDFAVVAHKLMDIENLEVLFTLAQMDNRVVLVGRSRSGQVDVGRIASALGGGGHPSAASATVRQMPVAEVKEQLIALLESQIEPTRTARDIMSYPLISLSPEAPLSEAHDMLSRYSINVLLVMDGQTLMGLISRQVVEKAIFLGVADQAVKEYMNPEFVTIAPRSTLHEIQHRIVGQRQRILPVVEGRRVVGVVTRSDLLNILMNDPPIPDALYDPSPGRNQVRKKDLTPMMTELLPGEIVALLRRLGRVADDLQYNAYVVGGFVRDLLLRRPNLDVDIVIEGDGIAFAQALAARIGGRVREHAKFGTAVVVLPDGFKLDVATARLEYYESPAALPIVELSSLKLDLYRRDFTINTLAVRVNATYFGTLLDYFGAQRDLKERTIRLLHSLSLVEDPTRALRAIRFEQRFGFKIGKLTANLIRNAIRIGAFSRANPARLMSELTNILEESSPARALNRMADFKLWRAIHPALVYDDGIDNYVHQVHLVLSWFDLLYLDQRPLRWVVFLLAVIDRLADRTVGPLCRRLAVLPKHLSLINRSRYWSRRIIAALRREPDMAPAELYHLFKDAPLEGLLWAMAKSQGEEVRRGFSLYFTELIKIKPLMNGHDLKSMGYRPGPLFGRILAAIHDARLNGRLQTVEDEEEFVRINFPLTEPEDRTPAARDGRR